MKFKVGDKVKIKNDPNNVSGIEADLMAEVQDGNCTFKRMQKILTAIEGGKKWKIVSISNNFGGCYEVRWNGIDPGFCPTDNDLE